MKSVIGFRIQSQKASGAVKKKDNFMELLVKALAIIVAGVGIIVFFSLLMSLPVMWLWNVALVPAIPGVAKIGWLQAWGILILSGLLFKSSNTTHKE